ncbi:polysaccharide deacetylase family protein [Paenibacillus sp. LHD-38]|uniref:polysaccharide deacetylase family protein n=1 Tax=Paenibacillus sp. LHD-38 TaxID=3072143 RepID=UPI00280D2E0D|nr:polysaccharide deacetylase family protein [Paenibacillus sp. LHD-38]MDQ8733854.1 polysaccharide deacetylase family protein [Paenibacillus sp. LHD-38]
MRRMLKVAICAMIMWFGLIELGSFTGDQSNAAKERETVQASEAATAAHYEAKPLLAAHASNETKQQSGKDQPANTEVKPSDSESAEMAEANQKIVYLTFDDGPSKNTEQVLDILKQEGISATFFVLGEHVLGQPEIAKRIIAEGHAIGNHTYDHKYERLYGRFSEFAEQVMKTDKAIYQTTGVRTILFRAPGGTYTNFDQGYFDAMAAAGYQVHDWNVDSGDSKRQGVPASEILTTIKGSKLASKLSVLLHDSAGHTESVKALPAIIKYYKSKGYAFAKITDEVAPIQFKAAGKLKWTRAHVTKTEITKLTQFSEKLSRESSLAQAAKNEPELIVHRGEGKLVLKSGEYSITSGAIEVSLRKLTEWVGGSLLLDVENGLIDAYYDGNRVLSLTSKEIHTSREGQVIVPVRAALQKFEIQITKYVYNDQQREIWLSE